MISLVEFAEESDDFSRHVKNLQGYDLMSFVSLFAIFTNFWLYYVRAPTWG